MNRILVFLFICIFFTTNAHSNLKFDKDLKNFQKTMVLLIIKGKFILKNK